MNPYNYFEIEPGLAVQPRTETAMGHQNLVVLRSYDGDMREQRQSGGAPRADYEVIAEQADARIVSAKDYEGAILPMLQGFVGERESLRAALAAAELSSTARNIFVTGEDIAFCLLPLLKMRGWKGRLHIVAHAIHSQKRQKYLDLMGFDQIGAIYTVCSQQRRHLTEGTNAPEDKVHFIYDGIDTKFFRPRETSSIGTAFVYACGQENRDYQTLIKAAPAIRAPIQIQATGFFELSDPEFTDLPSHVTLTKERVPFEQLCEDYAASAIVVVPVHDVPYAAGVTGLLEAMAMGKAVIATQSEGLEDYLSVPSVLSVPASDADALARAINELLEAQDKAEALGQANRKWVEQNAHLDGYCARIVAGMYARA